MAFDRESSRRQLVNSRGAGLDLVNFLADLAEKVMVVMRVLALVVRRGPGNIDNFHCAHVHENSQGSVNRGNPQSRGKNPGLLPNLRWNHRTGCVLQGFLHCLSLSGRVVHFLMVVFFVVVAAEVLWRDNFIQIETIATDFLLVERPSPLYDNL